MDKVLYKHRGFEVHYESSGWCGNACYGCGSPSIIIYDGMGYSRKCVVHTTRFWGRNRSLFECVQLAMEWIAQEQAKEQQQRMEAELAEEHCKDLAELANELGGCLP